MVGLREVQFVVEVMALFVVEMEVMVLFVVELSIVQECYILV